MTELIDLTMEKDEEEVEVIVLDPPVIPYINQVRVPSNFVPVCPTFQQTLESSFQTVRRGKKRKMDHLSASDAFAPLDGTDDCRFLRGEIDLDRELFNSGKLYFLTKLFGHITQHESLTDVEILILTSSATTEKLIYRICNEQFGLPCSRLSREYESTIVVAKNNHSGDTHGVVIRFTSTEVNCQDELINLSLVEVVLLFDSDVLPNFQDLNELAFDDDPCVISLCTIGTAEFRLKEYISRSTSYDKTSMDIFLHHANREMTVRFKQDNTAYSPMDFTVWNDLLAKQLAGFILEMPSYDYNFSFPFISEDDNVETLEA